MSVVSSRTVGLPLVSCRLCRAQPVLELRSGIKGGRFKARQDGFAHMVCCASGTESRKLISKSEIPVIYPRSDFVLQLFRWATIEAASDGLQNFGAAMNVEPAFKDPKAAEEDLELWGLDVFVLKDGEPQCQIGVYMDQDQVEKHEFVGIGEDRFPVKEGRVTIVDGKALEIWKVGEESLDDDTRAVVKRFCSALASAIDTYAAFGSCFVDDAT